MLPRKNGSRHKYSALLTVTYTLECGTECDLRLSKPHISAEKSLHRGGTHHIVLYFLYTAELIVRFNIAEMILEYMLLLGIGGECKALRFHTARIQLDKFLRHLLRCRFCLCLCLFPGICAKLVQPYRIRISASDIT